MEKGYFGELSDPRLPQIINEDDDNDDYDDDANDVPNVLEC